MPLTSIHAFVVVPQRHIQEPKPCIGGVVSVTDKIKRILKDVYAKANIESQTRVQFFFNESRGNEFRDLAISFLWGTDPTTSSQSIAMRLSLLMDNRSDEGLFVITVSDENDGKRQMVLWIFPKEDALQFKSGPTTNTINVLEDVFSKTSKLRKAAKFAGVNSPASMMSGHVLDYQNDASNVADFWVTDFLASKLSVNDDVGSEKLADALESLYNRTSEYASRERIYAAIITLKNRGSRRTTGKSIADEFFRDDVGLVTKFKRQFQSDELYNSQFNFKKDAFNAKVKVIFYQLSNGIVVTSPIGIGDDSLKIRGSESARTLTASGEISEEKVK